MPLRGAYYVYEQVVARRVGIARISRISPRRFEKVPVSRLSRMIQNVRWHSRLIKKVFERSRRLCKEVVSAFRPSLHSCRVPRCKLQVARVAGPSCRSAVYIGTLQRPIGKQNVERSTRAVNWRSGDLLSKHQHNLCSAVKMDLPIDAKIKYNCSFNCFFVCLSSVFNDDSAVPMNSRNQDK